MRWAIEQIMRRVATPPTVAELAACVGLSQSRFSHLFRRDTGTTPTRYLRTQRLVRAFLLLERTSLPVADVMAQVGYTDWDRFAREYRELHGSSPAADKAPLSRARRAAVTRSAIERWPPVTSVRLTRKLADVLDGVDLTDHKVGDIIRLPQHEADVLLAKKWAIPERRVRDRASDSSEGS